jgi:drug/metabolite transporter (DMT)-like permease
MTTFMTRLRADLTLLACAAVWGVAFLFQKRAMLHIGPFLFIALRSWLACLALYPLVRRELKTEVSQDQRGSLLRLACYAGLAFFGAAALQQMGLITSTVTNSGFLTALYVVITPLFSWLFMKHRPSRWVWVGAALSFVGTWLLGGGSLTMLSHGDLLVALSAILWALHVVLVGYAASFHLSATFSAAQFVVVGLLASLAALREPIELAAILQVLPDVLYVGILSSAVTFTLLSVALRATKPAEAAVIVSTESLFAALAAFLFMNESLPPIGWVGAAAIFMATLIVQLPNEADHHL